MLLLLLVILCISSQSNGISLQDFFPHGSQSGDKVLNQNNFTVESIEFPNELYYFDNPYRNISISDHGIFSFDDHIWIKAYCHESQQTFVNRTQYYKIHSNRSSSNATAQVFNKVKKYIRKYFAEEREFEVKFAIIGTWFSRTNSTPSLDNRFQMVLSSDGDRSFVFFLYDKLEWSSGNNQTYAGFHNRKGNQSESFPLPHSGTRNLTKLVNESNVNVNGLFVFRVDTHRINAGGCDHRNSSMISFRPRIASQFGSTALHIYGPCFTNQTQIKCRFGSSSSESTVTGFVIDRFRSICVTPFLSEYGLTSVHVSINNQPFTHSGDLTVTPLKLTSDEISVQIANGRLFLERGTDLTLKWQFSELTQQIFHQNTKLNIELWEVKYTEEKLQLNQLSPSIILRQNLPMNTPIINIQLPLNISNILTCFIRVRAHVNSISYAGLNSGLLVVRKSSNEANQLCQNWIKQQGDASTWNGDDLVECPMTITQAKAASRCCYKIDQFCYRNNSNRNNCQFHQARQDHDEPSAVECYLSISSNRHGAGAKCCYDNSNTLITRGTGAGTDDRNSVFISPIKHLFGDTLSYFECCLMNGSNDMCNQYMIYRPPRRGSNTMGRTGRSWGDPHFGTLDGFSYTFNGHGEYIYLAITNNTSPTNHFDENQSFLFMSQIRTIPIQSESDEQEEKGATVTTGFAAQFYGHSQSKPISITISQRNQILLYRANESIEFENNINSLSFPELILTKQDQTLTLSWFIGIYIEIEIIEMTQPRKQSVFNIAASIHTRFHKKTYGLLGTFDGQPNNDLTNRNGTILQDNSTLEHIHKNFGMTWSINPSKTLFHYESNQSPTFFQEQNRAFNATFMNLSYDPILAQKCGISSNLTKNWSVSERTCYYDLIVTNDTQFAKTSFNVAKLFQSNLFDLKNPPSFNKSLPLRMNSTKNTIIELYITATTEYSSSKITFVALHLPQNGTFNSNTTLFRWKAIKGEHYVSIQANDITLNLSAKHDIVFVVSSSGNNRIHFNRITYLLGYLTMIMYFCLIFN